MIGELNLEPLTRLSRDLKASAGLLTPDQARYLVDAYYAIQGYRIRAGGQDRAMNESGEPHQVITWVFGNMETMEGDIKRALDRYSDSQTPGRWVKGIVGIGPVLAAGLLAHTDITHCPTVGHLWSFAGLNPTVKWEKKTKRPWNARLKVICWKIGQSFMKTQNNPKDFYGHLYVQRKQYEVDRNERGDLADQAILILNNKKIGKDTEAYKAYSQGKLPPAHIDARARRWVVKLFLSHWQTVAYYDHYQTMPPKPYVLAILGHIDEIQVPQWPF